MRTSTTMTGINNDNRHLNRLGGARPGPATDELDKRLLAFRHDVDTQPWPQFTAPAGW